MMQLRTANSEDKPAIIGLLRMTLGESTIPKSELLWNWKHEQNPFGPSFLLLAEENSKLIGLRAFMKWQWQWKGQIYESIRAVDTATHPDHQGKGIFKKLTLHQIDICKQQGISFVFNTPNNHSKPGYLKMGWVEQGKLPLKFKVLQPLSIAYRRISKRSPNLSDISATRTWEHEILNLLTTAPRNTNYLTSNLSPEYISWRYERNPLFLYNHYTDNTNFLLISRIKIHPFARELRLVEFILLNSTCDINKVNKEMKHQVMKFCKENKIDFISLSGIQYEIYKSCFRWMGVLPTRSIGPTITLRDLNMGDKFPYLLQFKHWNFSLGDLELF